MVIRLCSRFSEIELDATSARGDGISRPRSALLALLGDNDGLMQVILT